MKFEILILTQPSRSEFLRQLMLVLEPQCAGRDVCIGIRQFDQTISLGENREQMRLSSHADYIAFVDDDDFVAADYVSRIIPLLDGVDQVGFRVKIFSDGLPLAPTFHSLKHGTWYQDANGYYRDISHVCPMRRELAMQVPMSGGIGEDFRWAAKIRELGIVKTENYIDEIMYFYYWRTRKQDHLDAREQRRLVMLDTLLHSIV